MWRRPASGAGQRPVAGKCRQPTNLAAAGHRFLGDDEKGRWVATDASAYQDYVAGRLHRLRRTAYLLCGDWHTADDLVSMTLTAGPAGTGSIRRRPVLPVGAGPGAGSAC